MNHKSESTAVPSGLRAGKEIEGFSIEHVTPIEELRSAAVAAVHIRTGARLLHLYAPSDTENCLAITFPTPPPDDTGIPHILEHSVLAGSRRYPVRDPFFEMLKMSMATFLNAMTANAYTVYPLAGTVKKDFFNLASVYLDAVFHPNLTEETFFREAHHLRLKDNSDPDSPLDISGVVYNEMKGAASSPERLMYRLGGCGLFPDTPIGRDSGGDPDYIPDLTYERLRRYHRRHYHPGRGLFFIYGSIPTAEHLRFLAPFLADYGKKAPQPPLSLQPVWSRPHRVADVYPVGANEELSDRTFLTLNWLVGDALDPAYVTDWKVLSTLLTGDDSAPLYKALIDSKLGADIFFSGLWSCSPQLEFHVGIKGSEAERADAFEMLVMEKLEQLAESPFPPERIESACHNLSYEGLEVQDGFPLHLLNEVNEAWPYGADPLSFLRFRQLLEDSRSRIGNDPALLNRLIKDRLLLNTHRLRVVLRPDRNAQARADAGLAERLEKLKAGMDRRGIEEIADRAAKLDAAQGAWNPPEKLETLPQLKISDLPSKPRNIPVSIEETAGATVLRNDVFANGVNYLEISVDLSGMPAGLFRWLPRYQEAFAKMGAAGQDFVSIAERRSACAGCLTGRADASQHAVDPDVSLPTFRFGLKTLDAQAEDALQLLEDLVFGLDPGDSDRMQDVMIQSRFSYRTDLVHNGYDTARRQALRGLSPAAALAHLYAGPEALKFVEELAGNFSARADELAAKIESVRDHVALHAPWTLSFTGSDAVFSALARRLEQWACRRGGRRTAPAHLPFQPFSVTPREGLAGPMKVAYCVKAMPAPHAAHPDSPIFRLGCYLAQFEYMLPEIRLKGNAYGAFARHSDSQCALLLGSYRDPRIVETLDVFDRFGHFFKDVRWSQADIDRAIIGCLKPEVRPIRPASANHTTLERYLRGISDELRAAAYAAVLEATPGKIRETVMQTLELNEPKSAVCVVSSREKLEAANERLGCKRLDVSDILG